MKNVTSVVINGAAGVGKDTFVDMVRQELGRHKVSSANISSVDMVKKAAMALGWDKAKDEKGRKFLSDLKDMSTALYDGPMEYMAGHVNYGLAEVIFFHIREPEEIKKFADRFPGTHTILVERNGVETFSNHADARVAQYDYDHIILNDGTLAELEKVANEFAANLMSHGMGKMAA